MAVLGVSIPTACLAFRLELLFNEEIPQGPVPILPAVSFKVAEQLGGIKPIVVVACVPLRHVRVQEPISTFQELRVIVFPAEILTVEEALGSHHLSAIVADLVAVIGAGSSSIEVTPDFLEGSLGHFQFRQSSRMQPHEDPTGHRGIRCLGRGYSASHRGDLGSG